MRLGVDREVSAAVPLWPDAGVPTAVVFVSSVAVISFVLLRAQPAKQIRPAVRNASFFIVLVPSFFFGARNPRATLLTASPDGRIPTNLDPLIPSSNQVALR